MEPAQSIVAALGGATAVSRITGVHRTRVYGWMKPKAAGGTGGTVPQKHIPALLEAAREAGIDLTAESFLPRQEEAA